MGRKFGTVPAGLALCLWLVVSAAAEVAAQGRSDRGRNATPAGVRVSVEVEAQIRDFYGSRPESGATALPPGIRRNLERGKPLPPGIAKKVAPDELRSRIELGEGYELVEVGLDVLLVEVATQVVHDVLMDVIR